MKKVNLNFQAHNGHGIPEFPESTRFINVQLRNRMIRCLIIDTCTTRWWYKSDSDNPIDVIAYEVILEDKDK